MLPLRTRLFIIISLVLLLVLGISIFLLVRNKKGDSAPTTPATVGGLPAGGQNEVAPVVQPTEVLPTYTTKPVLALEIEKNAVRQLAKTFIERYQSYSTDNDFANITSVEGVSTPALYSKISARLGSTSTPSQTFVGVTTQVIGTDLTTWESTRATVSLLTRKTMVNGSTESATTPTISVTLVKTGTTWLVDSFTVGK